MHGAPRALFRCMRGDVSLAGLALIALVAGRRPPSDPDRPELRALAAAWIAKHPGHLLPPPCENRDGSHRDADDELVVDPDPWSAIVEGVDGEPGRPQLVANGRFGAAMFDGAGALIAYREPECGAPAHASWWNTQRVGERRVLVRWDAGTAVTPETATIFAARGGRLDAVLELIVDTPALDPGTGPRFYAWFAGSTGSGLRVGVQSWDDPARAGVCAVDVTRDGAFALAAGADPWCADVVRAAR